jgi:glycine cleavage system H protein
MDYSLLAIFIMTIPSHLLHTAAHEWLHDLQDGTYAVGISHAGQDMLGDIVFCGDAAVGKTLKAGDTCALVESVKAASDVHMPIDGEVIAFNTELSADPAVLNTNAYGTWIVKIKPTHTANLASDLAALMSPTAYEQQL